MFRFKSPLLLSAIAALTITASAYAGNLKLLGGDKPVAHFNAKGPVGIGIDGVLTPLTFTDDGKTLTFTGALTNLDTKNKTRNGHAKERFKAAQYPDVKLVIDKSAVKIPGENKAKTSGAVTGKFTFHGKTKDVTVSYGVERQGSHLLVKGSFDINVADYGVDPDKDLCYLGVCVKPNVKISTNTFKVTDG